MTGRENSCTTAMLAVVNPAAGGGRCGKRAEPELARLRAAGVSLDVAHTAGPGDATALVRAARARGVTRFLAVGGDGTAYEVVNGLLPGPRATIGFLPLGTGNSFLKDYVADDPVAAIARGQTRPADAVRVVHDEGELFSINLFCLGFPANVATLTNRRLKPFGKFGYVLGVLGCLFRHPRRAFPWRANEGIANDARCLFVTFSNSRFTGGNMMIAPKADPADGLVEIVSVGPIGRFATLTTLPRLFRGTLLDHGAVTRHACTRVDFDLDEPIDAVVDGEVVHLRPRSLEVLPHALDVFA